jgi:hypothetical protein
MRVKVNGAEVTLVAKRRPDTAWDIRCIDPILGEFSIRRSDVLHAWLGGAWRPVLESDLADLAIKELEGDDVFER